MRSALKLSGIVLATALGSVGLMAMPAQAHVCSRVASGPSFQHPSSGWKIVGQGIFSCPGPVNAYTAHTRIKEDRNTLPDVVHLTVSNWPTYGGITLTAQKTTCQDGDAIYIEAQINNEGPHQTARRTMNC